MIALPLPFALDSIHGDVWKTQYWQTLREAALLPLVVTLIGVYVFGIIRDSFTTGAERWKLRLKFVSRAKGMQHRQIRGLETVNRELEERVSRQQDSITTLHSRIQGLYSLDLSKTLDSLLETVQKFTGATKASIWKHEPKSRRLRLAAFADWSTAEKANTAISDSDSIEGWVLRNNLMFSIKLLLQYDNLQNLDTSRNLLTLPISAGRQVWGVLNIEEIPFAKYNLYTEKMLMMILALAGPALERAVEYESVSRQKDIHPVTGLPSYSHFHSLLQSIIQRIKVQSGTLCIIIIELANFLELQSEFGEDKACALLHRIGKEVEQISSNRASLFHYKADAQLVALLPNLDYDGASLFCLDLLGAVNEKQWEMDGQEVALETIVGYAALGNKQTSAEEMLETAENLLEMQKV